MRSKLILTYYMIPLLLYSRINGGELIDYSLCVMPDLCYYILKDYSQAVLSIV